MTEIWKDIKGYEGRYQVSNLGRIKSLNYNKTGKEQIRKLKRYKGYNCISLWDNSKGKEYKVHRLVAEAFIPNPDNKPCVNHINTVRNDNRVWVNEDGSIDYDKSNLEWCTHKENNSYEPTVTKRRGFNNYKSKSVIAIMDNEIMLFYLTTMDSIKDGFNQGNVASCCRGERFSHKGYQWMYLDDYLADWWEQEMEKGAN